MKLKSIALMVIMFSTMLTFASFAEIVIIFDEDAKNEAGNGNFVSAFVSHDAGSTVTVVNDTFISGKVSAFCTPSQSYNPNIAGWGFSVNEYPYITFAWKKDGGTGIMIQLAYNGTWAYRYYSGVNVTNWPGIQLEKDIPKDWILYTRDLTEDFAKGWNLTGLALTPWDGKGGYYDLIMMHSEPDEGKKAVAKAVEARRKLTTAWAKIKN